jgi:hypothetical protein
MRKKAIKSKPLPSKSTGKPSGRGTGKKKKQYSAGIEILYKHVHPRYLKDILEITPAAQEMIDIMKRVDERKRLNRKY